MTVEIINAKIYENKKVIVPIKCETIEQIETTLDFLATIAGDSYVSYEVPIVVNLHGGSISWNVPLALPRLPFAELLNRALNKEGV